MHILDFNMFYLIGANPEHIKLVKSQPTFATGGFIICNANCSSTGLVVPLRALLDKFGLESVYVVTMQGTVLSLGLNFFDSDHRLFQPLVALDYRAFLPCLFSIM